MKTNQSNPQRYIKIKGQLIPVSEEVYRAYYRPIWRVRKQNDRQKLCRAEHGNRCTKDCGTCPHDRTGTPVSLECIEEAGHAHATYMLDAADIVALNILHQAIHEAIAELDSCSREIIRMLFFEEMTERQTAAVVGLSQKGVNKRKNRILAILREQLRDFLAN